MFELERRPKAQNIGNANGYLSGMFNFRWKVCRELKWRPFWKFWNIKHSFNLTSDMKRSSQIMPPKVFFCGDDVIDDVTGWPQRFSLYLCLGMVGSGSMLQRRRLVNKYQYHNCLSRLYMKKKNDLNEKHFWGLQVKGQHHRLIGWPWH